MSPWTGSLTISALHGNNHRSDWKEKEGFVYLFLGLLPQRLSLLVLRSPTPPAAKKNGDYFQRCVPKILTEFASIFPEWQQALTCLSLVIWLVNLEACLYSPGVSHFLLFLPSASLFFLFYSLPPSSIKDAL